MPEVLREGGVPDILADDAREGISPDDFPSCDVCDIFPSTPLPIPPLSLASLLYEQKCKLRGHVCTYHAAGRQGLPSLYGCHPSMSAPACHPAADNSRGRPPAPTGIHLLQSQVSCSMGGRRGSQIWWQVMPAMASPKTLHPETSVTSHVTEVSPQPARSDASGKISALAAERAFA